MFWALLALKSLCILLNLRARFRRVALYVGVSVAADLGRMPFADLRMGLPKPYVGRGFFLWLPDPALLLPLPACLLGAVFGWKPAVLFWSASFLFVAIQYPWMRGEELLRLYYALNLMTFIVSSATVVYRSSRRKISKEEAILLLFGLLGIGDVLLVSALGVSSWWGVRVVNTAAYVMAAGVSVQESARRRREDRRAEGEMPVQGRHKGD